MRNGRLLALLVVLVLSIAVTAPPAFSATCPLERDSTSAVGEVGSFGCKDDGSTSGDDDRWGDPNGLDAEDEVPTEGDPDTNGDSSDDEKSVTGVWALPWFLFGSWFVL